MVISVLCDCFYVRKRWDFVRVRRMLFVRSRVERGDWMDGDEYCREREREDGGSGSSRVRPCFKSRV